jgi:hypothetical protein
VNNKPNSLFGEAFQTFLGGDGRPMRTFRFSGSSANALGRAQSMRKLAGSTTTKAGEANQQRWQAGESC